MSNALITRGKWTNEILEEAMDAIENGTTLLKKASMHRNMPLSSLFKHLNGKTRFKKPGPIGVLTIKEN
jgi:hypothetical protein